MDLHRGEDEGQRRARQHVADVELGAHAQALRAPPGLQLGRALEEGEALAGGIARGGDAERAQVAAADRGLDRGEVEHALEQAAQGRVVEQRAWRLPHQPAAEQRRAPAQAAAEERERIDAVHLIHVQAAPDALDVPHRAAEVARVHGERDRVDRPRRGAAQDREGVAGALAAQFADRSQHADLVGGARATPGQHQRRPPFVRAHPPASGHGMASASRSAGRPDKEGMRGRGAVARGVVGAEAPRSRLASLLRRTGAVGATQVAIGRETGAVGATQVAIGRCGGEGRGRCGSAAIATGVAPTENRRGGSDASRDRAAGAASLSPPARPRPR
ncbi:MAG: hypothetical protein BWZ09_02493 [Alphaproteobacteria bacterium ADurb.BinA305]|nr:MAG: hypothetical protein BWZ09_02493 [Alphaproteobacteria bacterium ADurb.BinA305]